MFSKKVTVILVLIVLIGLGLGMFLFFQNKILSNRSRNISSGAKASSSETTITLESDWNAGTKKNIDSSSSPGNIKIQSGPVGKIDLSGKTVTASMFDATKGNLIDGNTSTYFGGSTNDYFYWQVDLGQEYTINKIRWFRFMGITRKYISSSVNGTDWTERTGADLNDPDGVWHDITSFEPGGISSFTARYLRVNRTAGGFSGEGAYFYEMEIYNNEATATHTSGDMQINGGDNFWGWETFTPTYSELENTDVKFRFRTSTNGSDPTGWSAYQTPGTGAPLNISSLVTSRDEGSGDDNSKDAANFTYYKYLQVETTLTSTVGDTTPTVSDYSIGYHTNVAPSKPVGGTAVIGQ